MVRRHRNKSTWWTRKKKVRMKSLKMDHYGSRQPRMCKNSKVRTSRNCSTLSSPIYPPWSRITENRYKRRSISAMTFRRTWLSLEMISSSVMHSRAKTVFSRNQRGRHLTSLLYQVKAVSSSSSMGKIITCPAQFILTIRKTRWKHRQHHIRLTRRYNQVIC